MQKLQISLLMLITDFCPSPSPSPLLWGKNYNSIVPHVVKCLSKVYSTQSNISTFPIIQRFQTVILHIDQSICAVASFPVRILSRAQIFFKRVFTEFMIDNFLETSGNNRGYVNTTSWCCKGVSTLRSG